MLEEYIGSFLIFVTCSYVKHIVGSWHMDTGMVKFEEQDVISAVHAGALRFFVADVAFEGFVVMKIEVYVLLEDAPAVAARDPLRSALPLRGRDPRVAVVASATQLRWGACA